MTNVTLTGIGVSRGIAIGRLHILTPDHLTVNERQIAPREVDTEIKRFNAAVQQAQQQLQIILKHITETGKSTIASVIDAHLLMLTDELLTEDTKRIIATKHRNAESALQSQHAVIMQSFQKIEDAYLRERHHDIDDVVNRIMRNLLQQTPLPHEKPQDSLQGQIVLADDLSPADTIMMKHHGIAAFATKYGGATSHTIILANSLGIPAIVGLTQTESLLYEGDKVILDGDAGLLLVNPSHSTMHEYTHKKRKERAYFASLKKLQKAVTKTADGVEINLQANIEMPESCAKVKELSANGVGLYRTEFLYMNRESLPSEEEHFIAYCNALSTLDGLPLTIRTLDIDAGITSILGQNIHTVNPSLGLRGIRLGLKNHQLFQPQLRAILRASAFGTVRLMLPMICALSEIKQVFKLISDIKQKLDEQGIAYDKLLHIGGMIEIPAAAICADQFAQKLDFLSIGTNDLIQYLLAIDRGNNEINYLYDPLHPAVLGLIHQIIMAGQKAQIPVNICGEMSSNRHYIPLLLGLGLRDFSVYPSMLLEIRQIINQSNTNTLTTLTQKILSAQDENKRQQYLAEIKATA